MHVGVEAFLQDKHGRFLRCMMGVIKLAEECMVDDDVIWR